MAHRKISYRSQKFKAQKATGTGIRADKSDQRRKREAFCGGGSEQRRTAGCAAGAAASDGDRT